MEAIKCPVCGDERVRAITEEKYECAACGNMFLVHNLSKEFRKTDEHITDMHEDINEKLDNLSKNVSSVTINAGAENSRAKEILFEAQEYLSRGKYCEAYTAFKKYTSLVPDSYVGYEGMYNTVLKLKGNDNSSQNKYLGYDILKKMIKCSDCDKETVLKPVMDKYISNEREIKNRDLKKEIDAECEKAGISADSISDGIENLIKYYEQQKQDKEAKYAECKENSIRNFEEYSKMTDEEKKKKKIIKCIPPVILAVVSLIFIPGIFKWIVVVIAAIWLWLAFSTNPTEWNEESELNIEMKNKIDEVQRKVDYWKNKAEIVNNTDEFTLSDMESIINNNSNVKSSDQIIEDEKIKQEDDIAGYWVVEVEENVLMRMDFDAKIKAEDAAKKYCDDNGIERYSNCTFNYGINIKNIRKSQAIEVQKLLQSYGVPNVNIRPKGPNEL